MTDKRSFSLAADKILRMIRRTLIQKVLAETAEALRIGDLMISSLEQEFDADSAASIRLRFFAGITDELNRIAVAALLEHSPKRGELNKYLSSLSPEAVLFGAMFLNALSSGSDKPFTLTKKNFERLGHEVPETFIQEILE